LSLLVALLGLGTVALAPTVVPGGTVYAQGTWEDRAWLGVNLQELNADLREGLGLDRRVQGALVTEVVEGSPVAEAGLEPRDVIVEIDGVRVTSTDEAIQATRASKPGKKITVVVNRKGEERSLEATLGSLADAGEAVPFGVYGKHFEDHPFDGGVWVPDPDAKSAPRANVWFFGKDDGDARVDRRRCPRCRHEGSVLRKLRRAEGKVRHHLLQNEERRHHQLHRAERKLRRIRERSRLRRLHGHDAHEARRGFRVFGRNARVSGGFLGVETQELSDQLATYFGIKEGGGVLVSRVVEDSPAAEAGLRAGDVILRVGKVKIANGAALRRAVRGFDPGATVKIRILRKMSSKTIEVHLGDLDVRHAPRKLRIELNEKSLQNLKQTLNERMEQLNENLRELQDQLRQFEDSEQSDDDVR